MVLDVAKALKYDALAPSPADLTLSPDLPDPMRARELTALPNALAGPDDVTACVLRREAGGHKVALVQIGAPALTGGPATDRWPALADALRQAKADGCLVVVLSRLGLAADEKLVTDGALSGLADLLIELEEVVWSPNVRMAGETAIILPRHGGKVVSEVAVDLSGARPAFACEVHDVTAQAELQQDVHRIVNAFLAASKPAPTGPPAATAASGGYISANECAACHDQESLQWAATPHAAAIHTLEREGRLEAECLRCHSEYYRRTLGFAKLPEGDDGVQCATCHGDGLLHSLVEDKTRILRAVPEDVCRDCHTPERSPNFAYDRYVAQVVHAAAVP